MREEHRELQKWQNENLELVDMEARGILTGYYEYHRLISHGKYQGLINTDKRYVFMSNREDYHQEFETNQYRVECVLPS